jgi:hypothetical protein
LPQISQRAKCHNSGRITFGFEEPKNRIVRLGDVLPGGRFARRARDKLLGIAK